MNEENEAEGPAAGQPEPPPLTESELAEGRRLVREVLEPQWNRTATETPTDPCYCRRHLLKPSWTRITDGPTWTTHQRTGCAAKDRPPGMMDEDWQEIEARREKEKR